MPAIGRGVDFVSLSFAARHVPTISAAPSRPTVTPDYTRRRLSATTCCEQVQRVIARLAYIVSRISRVAPLRTARANIVPGLPINPDPRTLMRIEGSIRQLWLHHDLDRLTLVHGPIAVWDLVEPNHPVEDAAGFDPALKHVWE